MNIFSHIVSTPAPPASLIGYLSDVHNLPEWATEFCQGLKTRGDGTVIAVTPMGEMPIRTEACHHTGVVDMITTMDGMDDTLHTRVTPVPGGSAWTVSFLQAPGLPDDVYAGQCESLKKEMANVARLFENTAVAG